MQSTVTMMNGAAGYKQQVFCLNDTTEKTFEDSGAKVRPRIHLGEYEPSHWKTNNAQA